MGVLANPDSNQAMVPSKQKRTHAVFCVSSAHRLAPTSKPRFVGEKVKLGELISKAKVERCGNRSFPVYSMTMHDGIVEQSGRFKKTIASKDTSSYKVVKKNQLVVGFPIDEGVIYVQNHDQPGIMSPAYNVWDFDSDRILPAYLEFALHSPQSMAYYAEKMRGTTARRRTLTGDALKNMSVPVPSIEDQYAVVKILNCIKSQLAATQQMLDKLDQLVKSRFVEMFESKDYGMRPMGDLVESITAGTNVGGQQRPLGEGEYGVLKISAVTQGVFNPGEFKVVNDVSHIKMIHPRKGDLLFSRANTSEMVGATAIVDKDYGDLFLPDKLWRLDPTDEVETVFLKALLSSPSIRAEMSKVSTGSSGSMQNISMAKFRKLPAFLPPLALQQEFAAFASQVDKSRFVRDHEMNFR